MKLKNILYALAVPFVLSAFAACSDIDENERLQYVEPEQSGRRVLIEDFTGQNCINCPTATELIGSLQEEYGHDTIIAVGIHSGPLSIPERVPGSLKTKEGQEYFDNWKPSSQPMGVLNRKSGIVNTDKWSTLVNEYSKEVTPVEMEIETMFDADAKQIKAHVKAFSGKPVSGKLQLWITEDGVVAMQRMQDGTNNKEYVHNHVFRASVNGTWGEDIQLVDATTFEKDFTINVDEKWKGENIHIVAFIYNDVDGVLQVVRSH